MAPDAIHPQVLSLQWDLAWATLHLSTVKMPAHNSYSPVPPERPAADLSAMVSRKQPMLPTFPMFRNLQQYLWGAFQRVLHRLWVAKELLSSTRVFLFLCSGYRAQAAMKCEAEKIIMGQGGAEGEKMAEMRPDQTLASMLKTQVEEETEVLKRTVKLEVEVEEEEEEEERETEAEDMEEFTDDEEEEDEEESDSDWMEWGSEEEDDVADEDVLHQQTIPTTSSCVVISVSLNSKQANEEEEEGKGDEEDSEWSEEEDDDSEASAESVELWESFLQSDDPYNLLSFSSWTTSRTSSNTHTSPAQESAENTHTSPVNGESRADSWEEEEEEEEEEREDRRHSTHNIQQKKVRFSDEVTVCPLVDWPQASSDARDGSCWMAMARDRDRFSRRVEDAGKVIGLCLSPEHRRLVWEKLQKQSAL